MKGTVKRYERGKQGDIVFPQNIVDFIPFQCLLDFGTEISYIEEPSTFFINLTSAAGMTQAGTTG